MAEDRNDLPVGLPEASSTFETSLWMQRGLCVCVRVCFPTLLFVSAQKGSCQPAWLLATVPVWNLLATLATVSLEKTAIASSAKLWRKYKMVHRSCGSSGVPFKGLRRWAWLLSVPAMAVC